MTMSNRQRQSGGDNSVNIQAQAVVYQGVSVEEARSLALDVFRANFYELAGLAADWAKARAEEITNQFLQELQERYPEGLNRAVDPDMQYAIFTAQREYARSGDKQLGDILVDILVDRSKEDGRSILQIVLNESLEVAPKLTSDQLATLSVAFTLKYSRFTRMTSLSVMKEYIEQHIAPFIADLTTKNSCYQHLEYAGCASISLGSAQIENIFLETYPGMFSKGFVASDLPEEFHDWSSIQQDRPKKLLVPCLHDASKLQLNAVDDESLEMLSREYGYEGEQLAGLKSLRSQHMMSAAEVREHLTTTNPAMSRLFEVWDTSSLKNLTLTSVGIAIGHANARRMTKDYDAELAIWVN